VSVIVTVLNERDSLSELLGSLLSQTRRPDEIVVSDAGSTDGTHELTTEVARSHPEIRLIHQQGNRSVGRNAAIGAATGDVIAATDGGCLAEPQWLEQLIEPLEHGADFVAGFYRPAGETLRSTCMGLVMVPVVEEVDPDEFLPSARSMAFRKAIWAEVGGFPEDTEFAEDTLFDERLVAAGYAPRFVQSAVVAWRPPAGFKALAATMYRWGRGDGLLRLRPNAYRFHLWRYGVPLLLAALLGLLRWWLAPLAALPVAARAARATRHKYRTVRGPARFLFIPIAHLVAVYSSLVGYLAGRLGAGRKEGESANSEEAGGLQRRTDGR
jgi:glycosyltransferase involved in cell wall biosynthesis